MKRRIAYLLAVLFLLSGCGNAEPPLQGKSQKVGGLLLPLDSVESVEYSDEMSCLLTLLEEENTRISVYAADLSEYEAEAAEVYARVQQQTWANPQENRELLEELPMTLLETDFFCEQFLTEENGETQYHLVGTCLQSGCAYTFSLVSDGVEGEAAEQLQKLLEGAVPATEEVPETLARETGIPQTEMEYHRLTTTVERNTLDAALGYLEAAPYSRAGLMEQMKTDGYTEEGIAYALDYCGADWEAMALQQAMAHLKEGALSRTGLENRLIQEGYTRSEAEAAARNCGAAWDWQALICAKDHLLRQAFSYDGLYHQLKSEGFTEAEAAYAVRFCEANWLEQAERCAKELLKEASLTRDQLIKQLEQAEFTHDQAVYGAQKNEFQ